MDVSQYTDIRGNLIQQIVLERTEIPNALQLAQLFVTSRITEFRTRTNLGHRRTLQFVIESCEDGAYETENYDFISKAIVDAGSVGHSCCFGGKK
jgi:hypothetical protein